MITRNSFNNCKTIFMSVIIVFALSAVIPTNIAIAEDTLQARKDIKGMGLEYTPQQFAKSAGEGDMTAVQLFIDAGMNVNSGGGAAIGLAAGRGQVKMVEYLLTKSAKPTADALQYARQRGHKAVEKLLLEAGGK